MSDKTNQKRKIKKDLTIKQKAKVYDSMMAQIGGSNVMSIEIASDGKFGIHYKSDLNSDYFEDFYDLLEFLKSDG